jgi:UDP-N-acetylmuramoylalanine--D-glutamate ligase
MLAIRDRTIVRMNDWLDQRVIVIGAARQGIALARYLVRHGAQVVMNDRLPIDQLQSAREALEGEPLEWICGGHPLSLLDDVDMIFISGGVPIDLPIVYEAQQRGIPISNDSQIFLEVCPSRVIGITGSAGKTTVTTLVGLMAQAAIDEMCSWNSELRDSEELSFSKPTSLTPDSKVWVGGNIGTPLLSMVDDMGANDLAVMELSSFQLEVMTTSPQISAILNITPNHLDRHRTMESYRAAKLRILQFQSTDDIAILNRDDPQTWDLVDKVQGRLVTFGDDKPPVESESAYLSSGGGSVVISIRSTSGWVENLVIKREEIPLRGEHNLSNVLGACAIGVAAGLTIGAIRVGIMSFRGIPHRLEFVRSWGGGDWYNDSIATAPERAVAAVKSFSEPLILLAGGRDKDLPWDKFTEVVHRHVKHLILFGEAVEKISRAMTVSKTMSNIEITRCSGLQEAVQTAANSIKPGDVVLLSPGGTSFDEFRDFEDRGEAFKKWVMELP